MFRAGRCRLVRWIRTVLPGIYWGVAAGLLAALLAVHGRWEWWQGWLAAVAVCGVLLWVERQVGFARQKRGRHAVPPAPVDS